MTELAEELPEALPGGLPPLTELLAWTTDHLIDGAAYLEQAADLWEHTTTSMWSDIHTVGWEGRAADAAKAQFTDLKTEAAGGGDRVRAAAREARSGAGDILRAQNSLRYAIEDAPDAGFTVYDDYVVEDPTGENPAGAQTAADTIYQRAKELVGVDTHVGDRIRQEAGDLDRLFDDGDENQPRIILVDHGGPLLPGGPLSPNRKGAVDYAEEWADGYNPAYQSFGSGDTDCTNFVSQAMRAGGFKDVGNGIDDWRRGDIDDWYYHNGTLVSPFNRSSKTWTLARDNYAFVTGSGRGQVVAEVATADRAGLDPLAPSRAGLVPGDLIYSVQPDRQIGHVSVYTGQSLVSGVRTDVINQHSGGEKVHSDWMPDSPEYTSPGSKALFVHLHYPGE